jgi:signal transduction histidine kinase
MARCWRLQKILEEFLSFLRAPEPRVVPIDLNARLQALVEFQEPEMRDAGVALRFYPGSDVGQVAADWDHLQAAVGNLLRNAKEATPVGGEVMVSTTREGDFALLRVTDTGSGIAPELQARVFEPYFSTKKAGNGLGLPTVRRVVDEHGGTVSMESEIGKGTQFSLRLPVKAVKEPTERE